MCGELVVTVLVHVDFAEGQGGIGGLDAALGRKQAGHNCGEKNAGFMSSEHLKSGVRWVKG